MNQKAVPRGRQFTISIMIRIYYLAKENKYEYKQLLKATITNINTDVEHSTFETFNLTILKVG